MLTFIGNPHISINGTTVVIRGHVWSSLVWCRCSEPRWARGHSTYLFHLSCWRRWSTYCHGFCIFVGGDCAIQNGPKCSPEVLSGLPKLGGLRCALWGNKHQISFAQACIIALLAMSSMFMNRQHMLKRASLNRSTHRVGLCTDGPMKWL